MLKRGYRTHVYLCDTASQEFTTKRCHHSQRKNDGVLPTPSNRIFTNSIVTLYSWNDPPPVSGTVIPKSLDLCYHFSPALQTLTASTSPLLTHAILTPRAFLTIASCVLRRLTVLPVVGKRNCASALPPSTGIVAGRRAADMGECSSSRRRYRVPTHRSIRNMDATCARC